MNSTRTLPGRLYPWHVKLKELSLKLLSLRDLKLPSLTLFKLNALCSGCLCSIFVLQGETVVILCGFASSEMDYSCCLYCLKCYFLTFF